MRRLSPEEVKKIQIEILDVVAAFCEENKINYWLESGTLIGAVRHKGYIPWDDDIDIGMLREDYDRFADLFNKSNDRYRFVDIDNTPDYYAAFAKIIDTNTVLYEPDKNGNKLSVNIDLFVFDNAPDDDKELKKMYDKRDRLQLIVLFSKHDNVLDRDSLFKRLGKKAMHLVCLPFSQEKSIKKMVSNSKKYSNENTSRVGNFLGVIRIASNKRIFDIVRWCNRIISKYYSA